MVNGDPTSQILQIIKRMNIVIHNCGIKTLNYNSKANIASHRSPVRLFVAMALVSILPNVSVKSIGLLRPR